MNVTVAQLALALGRPADEVSENLEESVREFMSDISWTESMGPVTVTDAPKLPPVATMARNVVSTAWDSFKAVMKGEPLLVPDEVKAQRQALCDACPFYIADKARCSKCGCFMSAKTAVATSKCPVGKWGKYTEVDKAAKDADAPA